MTVGSIFVQSRSIHTFTYIINANNKDSSGRHSAKRDKLYALLCQYCSATTQAVISKLLDTHTSFILDVEQDKAIVLTPDFELSREQHKIASLEGMRNQALAEETERRKRIHSLQNGGMGRSRADEITDKMWRMP